MIREKVIEQTMYDAVRLAVTHMPPDVEAALRRARVSLLT